MFTIIIRDNCQKYLLILTILFNVNILTAGFTAAPSIVFLPVAAGNGAAVASDPLYISAAEEIISILKGAGFKVAQSDIILPQHMPRRKRPSTKDWKRVFQRQGFEADFLVTLMVTRHIQRSPVNETQIGFTAMLFNKVRGVRLIGVVSMPPKRSWTVHPRCFGPCLTAYYARNAKPLARILGKKLNSGLLIAAALPPQTTKNIAVK